MRPRERFKQRPPRGGKKEEKSTHDAWLEIKTEKGLEANPGRVRGKVDSKNFEGHTLGEKTGKLGEGVPDELGGNWSSEDKGRSRFAESIWSNDEETLSHAVARVWRQQLQVKTRVGN